MICISVFIICLIVRFIEYFAIKTDETIIGENFIHKLFGIFLFFILLKLLKIKWNKIGFDKGQMLKNTLKGLFLGIVCFGISYSVECLILYLQGYLVHFEFYISGFSLSGQLIKNTGAIFIILCVVFNVINVFMEEGIFRGFFISIMSSKHSFLYANLVSALLFGVWHFVMPARSFMNGEMKSEEALLMCVGYIVLSGIMSIKWGLLYRITGNLWAGIGDHFFNNTIATNMVHVVTETEADTMQIIRIMIAQLISFVVVVIIYEISKSKFIMGK